MHLAILRQLCLSQNSAPSPIQGKSHRYFKLNQKDTHESVTRLCSIVLSWEKEIWTRKHPIY